MTSEQDIFSITLDSLTSAMSQNMIQDVILDCLYNAGILQSKVYYDVMAINDVSFCKQAENIINRYNKLNNLLKSSAIDQT